jgi:hypothetical protein
MSKQHKLKHYTVDDLNDAVEDEQAKFIVWRSEAIRELRACLWQDAVSGKDGVSK